MTRGRPIPRAAALNLEALMPAMTLAAPRGKAGGFPGPAARRQMCAGLGRGNTERGQVQMCTRVLHPAGPTGLFGGFVRQLG